jgi:hypothetical protein
VDGIPTFSYLLFSGSFVTPAFVSLQKMYSDQTQFCTYSLDYTTAFTGGATATTLAMAIDGAALKVSLNSST